MLENTQTRISESVANTHQTFWVFVLLVEKQKLPHQEGKVGPAGNGESAARLRGTGAAIERASLDGMLEARQTTPSGTGRCAAGAAQAYTGVLAKRWNETQKTWNEDPSIPQRLFQHFHL